MPWTGASRWSRFRISPARSRAWTRPSASCGSRRIPFRIDPILEPIGFGFAASLGRYLEVRRRYPEAAIMMGTGNLTELTDVDSAGVNTLLVGFCQELASSRACSRRR